MEETGYDQYTFDITLFIKHKQEDVCWVQMVADLRKIFAESKYEFTIVPTDTERHLFILEEK